MQELRLVAVSEDGSYLVLATAGRGTRFTLPVDDRLRAAVRGHFSRLGQFEIEVESPLRPKEIQARIRAGETAEEIAESAGIPVERVRWFEGPVLQEREYMAQQAQRVTVRRQGETSPAPPLGEMVEERLGRRGVDLEEAEWDSWKCEDNTWRVRLSFFDDGRPNAAEWIFDPRRRQVSPLDEEAAVLSSQVLDESVTAPVTQLLPRRPAMKIVSDTRSGQVGPAGQLGPRREDAAASRITDPTRRPAVPARWDTPGSTEEGVSFTSFDEGYEQAADNGSSSPSGPSGPSGRPGEDMGAVAEATGVYVGDPSLEQTIAPPRASAPAEAQAPVAETATEHRRGATEAPASPSASQASSSSQASEPEPVRPAVASAPARDDSAAQDEHELSGNVAAPEPPQHAHDPRPEPASRAPQEPAPGPSPERPKPTTPAHRPAATKPSGAPPNADPATPVSEPVRPVAAKAPAEPPARPAATPTPEPAQVAAAAVPPEPPAAPPARGGRRKSARGKRASVPSWDEIMFGARRPD